MEKCYLCFGIVNTMGLENDKWNYIKGRTGYVRKKTSYSS